MEEAFAQKVEEPLVAGWLRNPLLRRSRKCLRERQNADMKSAICPMHRGVQHVLPDEAEICHTSDCLSM